MIWRTRKVYESALCLLAESTAATENADYEERAPYILAVFCNEALALDEAMRKFTGQEEDISFDGIYLGLDDKFPLLPRFATLAALYLAAMLVLDDNAELSDKLYEKYEQGMRAVCDGMIGLNQSITDKYFAD